MNCVTHPEVPAVAYCRTCGRAMCPVCQRTSRGTVFCEQHLPLDPAAPPLSSPVTPEANPYTAPYAQPAQPAFPANSHVSPGLAFVLGLIPGVGAIYNAQYAKGIVHVVILGLLISIPTSNAAPGLEPLFAMLIALWFPYMAFEAYHTARKRQLGEPVDEFSSLVPGKSAAAGFPVLPLVLIAVGVVFLMNNLGLLSIFSIMRYWPVFLIALGAYLLYLRLSGDDPVPTGEASHERN